MTTALTGAAEWGTNSDTPVNIFPAESGSFAYAVLPGQDGTVWGVKYQPRVTVTEGDEETVRYEYSVQHWDRNGNAVFPAAGITVSDYSNVTYTVINERLLVDSDGNAIICVSDCRNSSAGATSYTAYKLSPEGKMLWGEEGVPVSDPLHPATFTAKMNIIELDDHSYVFAWMQSKEADDMGNIYMQRLNKDGKMLWDQAKVSLTDDVSENLILLNSGDNTFILVYTRGASSVLTARKMDFDGESVWGGDVRIYRGGWGMAPVHTYFTATASGDGGALVSWCDDRSNTNLESPYMSYVTADGRLGFSAQADEGDLKLLYAERRNFNVCAVPAADGSCFYAVWRTSDANEHDQGILMQKVSKEGELLWGDEAKVIEAMSEAPKGYISLQQAGESDAVCFYGLYSSHYDQQCMATRFDGDGNFVWGGEAVALSPAGRQASMLRSATFPDQDAFLCSWTDGGTSEQDAGTAYFMTRLNDDGTLGLPDTAVPAIVAENASLSFDRGSLRGVLADGTVVNIFTTAGIKVAECVMQGGAARVNLPSGLYVAAAKGITVKLAIK